jgi:4-hydroxy-4-methyl-2-oxoglutarate aldolase
VLTEKASQCLDGLYSAVICDALDRLGYRCQGMTPMIRPLFPEARAFGPARTLLSVPKSGFPEKPYEKELEALDRITLGDVIVFATTQDGAAAVWGELLSTAAKAKGCVGVVVDGLTRDAARICRQGFPVFAEGISPYDSYGRSEVVSYDAPIECGGVRVEPNDVVFADYDGIVVIPSKVLGEVLSLALEKSSRERVVEREFRKGRKVAEVFAEHGIL